MKYDPLVAMMREMKRPYLRPQGAWPWPDPTNTLILDLEARIHAVRVLHRHVEIWTRGATEAEHRCAHCETEYPCPTIRILDGTAREREK